MANDHGWMETNKWDSELTQYWWIGGGQVMPSIKPVLNGSTITSIENKNLF